MAKDKSASPDEATTDAAPDAPAEMPAHPADAIVEAWFAKRFHNLGHKLDVEIHNILHDAKEELKTLLHAL